MLIWELMVTQNPGSIFTGTPDTSDKVDKQNTHTHTELAKNLKCTLHAFYVSCVKHIHNFQKNCIEKTKQINNNFDKIEHNQCTLYRVAPKKKRNSRHSRFFRTFLWSTVIFFTLLDRASFPHYNNTKIIKFGWELLILWVISYVQTVIFGICPISRVPRHD